MFLNNFRNCGVPMQQAAANAPCCPCPPAEGMLPPLPDDPVVTMAYVPFQTEGSVYPIEQALLVGTLFPVLNKPFTGVNARCCRT